MDERGRRRLGLLARFAATLAAVALLVWWVDLGQVGARLLRLDARFVALFLLASLPLYLLLAWRWWFTARRVGAPLGFRRAFLDYYVSTLLNQVLPFGVAGDVVRGARHHGRLPRGEGAALPPAATAILFERLSGFAGLLVLVAPSAALWLVRGRGPILRLSAGALVLAALVAAAVGLLVRARRARFADDARAALLVRGALAFQLVVSTAAATLMVLLFALSARATGARLDLFSAVQIVPLVLLVAALPWAFGGWGAREATVAALYQLAGLDAATGVAVSVTFGLLSLAAALPGLVVLVLPDGARA